MTGEASAIAPENATRQTVVAPAIRSVVSDVMNALKAHFRHKPSAQLAAIVGCDIKTAERYFAGARTPNGEAVIAILRHPAGVAMVEEATRTLPADDYRKFWSEMSRATLRAMARGEQEEK